MLWVTPWVSTACIQSSGVNCGRMTRVRPPQMDDTMAVAPAMWNTGTLSRVLSWSALGSAGAIVFVT